MKKILIFMLAMLIVFSTVASMVSCGNDDGGDTNSDNEGTGNSGGDNNNKDDNNTNIPEVPETDTPMIPLDPDN